MSDIPINDLYHNASVVRTDGRWELLTPEVVESIKAFQEGRSQRPANQLPDIIPAVPQAPLCRLEVDDDDLVRLDGRVMPLKGFTVESKEQALRFLRVVIDNGRVLTPGPSIDPRYKEIRWDRIVKKLPREVRNLIGGKRGAGYYLLESAWNN
jgi:hypothetical protein